MSLRSSLLALTMMAVAAGCAVSPEQPGPQQEEQKPTLSQGLNILSISDRSMSVAYKRDSVVVYLQTVRGRETASVYQADPSMPKYEMDARAMSDDGHYFWVQRGGDQFVDPTWAEDFDRADKLPRPKTSNRNLFEMLSEATQQLPGALIAQVGAVDAQKFAPHVQTLGRVGQTIVASYVAGREQVATDIAKKGLELAKEVPYGTGGPEPGQLSLWQNYWYLGVYNETIYAVGKHSATREMGWDGSGWNYVYDMCNHGDCPGAMSWVCWTTGSYRYQSWNVQTCLTGYDWESNGGHNCHDDTRVQQANFAEGRYNNGYQQWCADGDHASDISAWPGDLDGSPNCSSTDTDRGYAYR